MVYMTSFSNILGNLVVCFYIYHKSINLSLLRKQKLATLVWILIMTFLSSFSISWLPDLLVKIMLCSVCILFLLLTKHSTTHTVVSAFLLSYGLSYCLLYISMIITGVFFIPIVGVNHSGGSHIDFNNPIYILIYILFALFQFFLAFLFFRIKRFKKGFPFLFEQYAIIIALLTTGVVIVITSFVTTYYGDYSLYLFFTLIFGVFIIGVGIIIWIRNGIKMFYKRKIKERDIEILEQELVKKENEIQYLINQNNSIRIANHKVTHRLSALEYSVAKLIEEVQRDGISSEVSQELSISLEDIKRLSSDYQYYISKMKSEKQISSTKIKAFDDLLIYFSKQCADINIDLILKINGSIPYMVDNIIQQHKLETLIGDHFQNAIIAINTSNNSLRSILVILGLTEDYYEYTVYDSGIPFEIGTLVNLGTEYITTHTDSGGSGIGFMTTFEIMRECNASLIINEKPQTETDFTKSVTVRFDGKNQYIIETYRSECFPQNDRYLVVSCSEN